MNADTALLTALESAFRRGFVFGVQDALEHIEREVPPERMAEWLAALERWRDCDHQGKFETPPMARRDA